MFLIFCDKHIYDKKFAILLSVDASEAGQGTLDFSVGPPGKTIPHDIKNVGTQVFLVEFSPIEPVDHEVSIQFNEMHINGK